MSLTLHAGARTLPWRRNGESWVFSVDLPPVGAIRISSAVTRLPKVEFESAVKTGGDIRGTPVYWTHLDDSTVVFYPPADQDYVISVRKHGGVELSEPAPAFGEEDDE